MQVHSQSESQFTLSSAAPNTATRLNGGRWSKNISKATQRGRFKWRVNCCRTIAHFSFAYNKCAACKMTHLLMHKVLKCLSTVADKKVWKKLNLLPKQKGKKWKIRTTNQGLAYAVFGEDGQGEDGVRGEGVNVVMEGDRGYTGGIRTKASPTPAEKLMRVQIHFWLIIHYTLWHRGWTGGG